MRGIVAIDSARLRRYRLERVRAELRARDYAGVVFADAINLRYATDARNMQIWTLRNPARYVFIATDGPVVMFEFAGCHHLAKDIETIDEIRTATGWFYFTSGPRVPERAQKWAAELADLVQRHGGNRGLLRPGHRATRRQRDRRARPLHQIRRRDRLHVRVDRGLRGRAAAGARGA